MKTSTITRRLESRGYIAILWHIDDVKEVRPDLTRAQCKQVLQQCKHSHDASIGINWEVIDTIAGHLFPEGVP